jgi:putative membrane protein
MNGFFSADLKREVTAAIKTIESASSAEIVVAVRPQSATYREIDLAFVSVFALVVLTLLVFLPEEFNERFFPLEVLATFLVAAFFSATVLPFKRLLLRRGSARANVKLAACMHFMQMRLGRTRDRSAILVYVSAFERCAEVVTDTGIDAAKVGAALSAWQARLCTALQQNDPAAFVSQLASVGDELGQHYPRRTDDTNELADELDE